MNTNMNHLSSLVLSSTWTMNPTILLIFSIVLLAVAFVVGGQSPVPFTVVPAILTFGDSTVDVGNNNYLASAMFKANFLPYGRDFSNTPTGRFSDGKLVTDFTAETLGFAKPPEPYLSPNAKGKMLLMGANFASAGSGYYDKTSNTYDAISMSKQLEYLKEYRVKLVGVAGEKRAASILSDAICILSTGNGDYVQNYYINPSLRRAYAPDEFASLLIGNFSTFVQELFEVGVRRIGVTSLPPLGCLPAAINLHGNLNHSSCIQKLNYDAQRFNSKLNATVDSLRNRFPEIHLAVLDIYKPLLELATNPTTNGFVEARKGCCETGTSRTSVLCKPNAQICPNASTYVFWDGVHPSQAANNFIAKSVMVDGISLIP